jgi:hypothetical protein
MTWMTWTPEDEWAANTDLEISKLTKRVAQLEIEVASQHAVNKALYAWVFDPGSRSKYYLADALREAFRDPASRDRLERTSPESSPDRPHEDLA